MDNIIQEGEVIFNKDSTVGLQEVSELIDSGMSKREGDQRKHSFLEKKKILHKWENGFTMNIRNTPIDRPCYEAIDSLISQDIFSYLKMFSMQYRKNRVEDNKKRMNIASYINVYTLAICDKNDSK